MICNSCNKEEDISLMLEVYSFWILCTECQSKLTRCPECKEVLGSHANRGHKYFHKHVRNGPYPNSKPHSCKLVDFAFEYGGVPIIGSDISRRKLVESIHHGYKCEPTPNT